MPKGQFIQREGDMGKKVAIVGRPNVGKSSLFNRLIGKRKAIVHDMPGVTRDRVYGELELEGESLVLIDTGGYISGDAPMSVEIMTQTAHAIEESDAVIFVVDGKDGLIPMDKEIGDLLRKSLKEVIVCVNKADNQRLMESIYDFYELGFDKIIPVSAVHGKGIDDLVHELMGLEFPDKRGIQADARDVPNVTIVGRPNVGKSSLLNRIVGSKRVIVSEIPGTTRDLIDMKVEYQDRTYVFIDTPGVRKRSKVEEGIEKISAIKALDSIKRCDIALLVIDAASSITDQDLNIAGNIDECNRGVIIVLNKWDLVKGDVKREQGILREVNYRFDFLKYAPVLRFSAKTGLGIKNLMQNIDSVYEQYSQRVDTGRLNRELRELMGQQAPPRSQRKVFKFFYATQVSVRPPTVVLFVNHPEVVVGPYERFLKNRVRKAMGLYHCPLKMLIRKRK